MSNTSDSDTETITVQESTLFSHKGKLLVALAVLVGSLSYLGFMAFQSATVYYYTVDEIKKLENIPEGKMVRVSGKLVSDSFSRIDGATVAYFELTDDISTMRAFHEGVVPDLFFNEHSEIILEGSYSPERGFESYNIIVKCPSKYIAAE